jgi:methylated-DNA-[protein]-cysteine S-methyltransferase
MSCVWVVVRYDTEMQVHDKPSIFAQRVYDVVRTIPRGKVATYRDVAQTLGIRSAQAVGQALKTNPFAPEVPCHRVISSSGRLGGFFGETAGARIEQKTELLRAEGVTVVEGKIDMTEYLHTW